MAGGLGAGIPIPDRPADTRLGPADVHEVVRQRLGRMSLRPADIHRLAHSMPCRLYQPGEIIVPRGIRADCLGVVVRGQVAVHTGARSAARLVVVLLPGSTFGEMMLSDGHPSQVTLQALTRCEIRFLRRSELEAVRRARRTEQQATGLWQAVRAGTALLLLLAAVLAAVTLPASRRALAVVPMGVGQWCSLRNQSGCAEEAWQVAATLTPLDPGPLLALGNLYFRQGDIANAEQSFDRARSLAPDLAEVHNNLGLIYARQGQQHKAIAAFRRALELEPGIAAVEHNLALSLQSTKAYDEALAHYRAALALGEPQASSLVNMAVAYYESDQPGEAGRTARLALTLDEDLALAHTVLGAVALESREAEGALVELQRAITLDAGQTQAHFFLGLAYKSLDRFPEAIAAFEQALARASNESTRVQIRRHLQELYQEEDTLHSD